MKISIFLFLIFYLPTSLFCQVQDSLPVNPLSFIRFEQNVLKNTASPQFVKKAELFNKVLTEKKGQVRFLHLGDSHIQADFMTNEIRTRLQNLFGGQKGARGLVFPFKVARTNNPRNYSFSYTGVWKSCRNVARKKGCELGVCGMMVSTNQAASLTFANNPKYHQPSFNRIRIYHLNKGFQLKLDDNIEKERITDSLVGYTDFILNDYCQKFTLRLKSETSRPKNFELYGISLESDSAGVVYEAEGVNGAGVSSFLGCSLLDQQLTAQNPDFVVISLGTNDAYYYKYNDSIFYGQYSRLISRIRKALPDAAIILTTPPDHYLQRKKPNARVEGLCTMVYKLANEQQCAVWDLFSIMGGLGSVKDWQKNNLAGSDKIHFTQPGYFLQGKLFFDALMKAFRQENNITSQNSQP
jgi:lysophospholipase L1-like esterase